MRKRFFFAIIPVLIFSVLFFLSPNLYMESFSKGLAVWAAGVLPSLFPFLIISNLLVNSDSLAYASEKIGGLPLRLFKAPRESTLVFILSLLCGYPIGAKSSAELYEKNIFTTKDCYKTVTFCSMASPIYAIGTVGINFLGGLKAGLILYFSIIMGQLLCGLIFRRKFTDNHIPLKRPEPQKPMADLLGESLYSAIKSIVMVGAYIAIFYMLCEMAANTLNLILPPSTAGWFTLFFVGFLEMTNGAYAYAACFPVQTAIILCSIVLGFGGVCVYLQCFPYYKKCRMSGGKVLCIKLLQGILSGLVCLPLSLLFL